MAKTRGMLWLTLGLLAVGAAVGVYFGMGIAHRRMCQSHLRALAFSVQNYYSSSRGRFAPDFDTLMKVEQFGREAAMCPGAPGGAAPGSAGDYTYLDWSGKLQAIDWSSCRYPVLYDCRMANHRGAGINIAMVDGTVLWDPGAEWLKRFAAGHPEMVIPIPK